MPAGSLTSSPLVFTTGIKQLAYCLLDTAACRKSAVLPSSLLFFGHSLCFTESPRLTLHFSNFNCLEIFLSTGAFRRTTSLYDVTLSTGISSIGSTIRGFPPSLESLFPLSINFNTPLLVAPCIPECPISELQFTSDSALPQYTPFIQISTGSRTTVSGNSDFKILSRLPVTRLVLTIAIDRGGTVVQHAKIARTPPSLTTSLSCDFPSCVS